MAFIFGSIAGGTENAGSDVDLLVIGGTDFGSVVDASQPAQQQLGREINPKVFSLGEWKAKLRSKDSFVGEIMRQPKIFLIGNEDELAKLGRRKP
ncbi:MAG: nucleotidyltransferase domain-containing protein [Deltaproteobacteria bacterium]